MEVERKETVFILLFESFDWKCSRITQSHGTPQNFVKRSAWKKASSNSCYQKFFQSTPHADLLQIRMDKAKNLLTNEALTVQQIAQMCGFQIFPISADILGNRRDALPCNGAGKWESPH